MSAVAASPFLPATSVALSDPPTSTATSAHTGTFPDYHRTTVHLNQRVQQVSKLALPAAYSQKAVFLKNVAPDAALYLPSMDSVTESHVFPSEPVKNREQAPVAFTAVGEGWLGYVGDANAETESDAVILAMCGL
jgi:hypothetical protein